MKSMIENINIKNINVNDLLLFYIKIIFLIIKIKIFQLIQIQSQ